MNCTRCQGTGFLNIEQVPDAVRKSFDETGEHGYILDWIAEMKRGRDELGCSCHISPPCPGCDYLHDVAVCDCCGNGEDWYGVPGEHNNFKTAIALNREPFPECY